MPGCFWILYSSVGLYELIYRGGGCGGEGCILLLSYGLLGLPRSLLLAQEGLDGLTGMCMYFKAKLRKKLWRVI